MLPDTEKDLRHRVSRATLSPQPHLFVVLEGGRPTAGGARYPLQNVDEVMVGRGEGRTADYPRGSRRLVITLPDSKVSIRHARLTRAHAGWRIEDFGSTNGTFVNGRRVAEQALADGDLLALGRTLLRVRFALPTAPQVNEPSLDALGLSTLVPALAAELAPLVRAAGASMPVLLLGDTGTGKEVGARAVHAASGRAGEFVAINCAALPDSLIEAQLFGHVRGAFSGATRDEVGFVRRAHRGTLFLDEIGDLPKAAQGVLLRFLQEGEVVPVGTTHPAAVDVRVIAATHQPIEAMVERGEFRRDLFARLQGFTCRLWALSERREDIGTIVAQTLARLVGERASDVRIAADASRALVAYSWPLNVRELVLALSHALALSQDREIELEHLPPPLAAGACEPQRGEATAGMSSEDVSLRGALVEQLERHHGNVAAVARHMKKAPMQIYRWMQRLGVDPRTFR